MSLTVRDLAKRKREEEKEKIEKTNNSINRYFSNRPVAAAPKVKVIVSLLSN